MEVDAPPPPRKKGEGGVWHRNTHDIFSHGLRYQHLQSDVFVTICQQDGDTKTEYRAWNPFRSKLAAAIVGGIEHIHMKPGSKVLYLGAASGTTVSHVSDLVGPVSQIGNP